MSAWTIADVWEAIAGAQPEKPALIQGPRVVTWGDFSRRADALAASLVAGGLGHQSKVAAYLYNAPEYLETYLASFKAGLVPFNTNFRYGAEELLYLFDNADAEAIVFHAGFAPLLEPIRARLGKVKKWIAVAEPGQVKPAWAEDYEAIVSRAVPTRPFRAAWGRSPEDLMLLYTGGTTGMPKGVMWRQDDLFNVIGAGAHVRRAIPPLPSVQDAADRLPSLGPQRTALIACPLMHGTGLLSSVIVFNLGSAVAMLPARRFDAVELWREAERLKVDSVTVVGSAFAVPMLDALDANPGRWDLSSITVLSSSGSMWSQENKRGLLRHCGNAVIVDSWGSSEALGLGGSEFSAQAEVRTASFMIGPSCAVFTEDGRRVQPGSGEKGLVAVTGFLPLGYYKDPEKTAKTFRIMEGVRWSVPGDWAEVHADGTLTLLGRGSQCINTGGEKVFPEEVEEALKTHRAVRDAVVVGAPHPRYGEQICAVVELEPGSPAPSPGQLAQHVKAQLAHYKAPREFVIVEAIGRAPNGKVDYKAAKDLVLRRLNISAMRA